MRTIKIFIFALIVLSANMSCNTPKHVNKMKAKYCKDYTETIIRDSLVKIPVFIDDSAYMELYLGCTEGGEIYQKERIVLNGKISSLESSLVNNKVYVYNTVKVRDTVLKTLTNTKIIKGVNTTTNILTRWQSYQIISFWILLVIVILYLAYRIIKSRFRLFFTSLGMFK